MRLLLFCLSLSICGCATLPFRIGASVTLVQSPQTEIEYGIHSTEITLKQPLSATMQAKYENRLIRLKAAKQTGRRWVTEEDM